jgi:osmotically-inducible protein OsmY
MPVTSATPCRTPTETTNPLSWNVNTSSGLPSSSVSRLRAWEHLRQDKIAAEQTISRLIGVRNITNEIEVLSDEEAPDVNDLVRGALDRYGLIGDDSDVTVDASDGTVTLRGHVRTWAEHDVVIGAAWMGPGVSSVRDDLVVTG